MIRKGHFTGTTNGLRILLSLGMQFLALLLAPHPYLRKVAEEYVTKMNELGGTLMSILALGLGLPPKFFHKYTDNPFWLMRVIGYPPVCINKTTQYSKHMFDGNLT